MSKTTPGPWRVEGADVLSRHHGLVVGLDPAKPARLPDLLLIAAAPELLELVRQAAEVESLPRSLCREARALIRRIEEG